MNPSIANGKELFAAAKEFANCLDNYLKNAMRGTKQLYVVRLRLQQPAVICLTNDGSGWYLEQARSKRNRDVAPQLLNEIHEALLSANIRCEGWSVAEWMAEWEPNEEDALLAHLLAAAA